MIALIVQVAHDDKITWFDRLVAGKRLRAQLEESRRLTQSAPQEEQTTQGEQEEAFEIETGTEIMWAKLEGSQVGRKAYYARTPMTAGSIRKVSVRHLPSGARSTDIDVSGRKHEVHAPILYDYEATDSEEAHYKKIVANALNHLLTSSSVGVQKYTSLPETYKAIISAFAEKAERELSTSVTKSRNQILEELSDSVITLINGDLDAGDFEFMLDDDEAINQKSLSFPG